MNILEEKWKKFKLSEGEATNIVLEEEEAEDLQYKEDRSLVCKLCSVRTVSGAVIESTMAKVWRISKAATFTEVSTNIFVITFNTQVDKLRVWEGRPWLFDGHLMALKVFDGLTPPQGMVFDHASFWVRMHDLPLSYMTKTRGEQIGRTVGRVEEVVTQEDGSGWGNYLRVQINLNITQPLARGRTIMVKGKEMWIPFSYEKLPRLCFSCGCMVHGAEGCSNRYGKEEDEEQYGSWMRASLGSRVRIYTNNKTESERKNKDKNEEIGGGVRERRTEEGIGEQTVWCGEGNCTREMDLVEVEGNGSKGLRETEESKRKKEKKSESENNMKEDLNGSVSKKGMGMEREREGGTNEGEVVSLEEEVQLVQEGEMTLHKGEMTLQDLVNQTEVKIKKKGEWKRRARARGGNTEIESNKGEKTKRMGGEIGGMNQSKKTKYEGGKEERIEFSKCQAEKVEAVVQPHLIL